MCPSDLILNYEFQGRKSNVKVMASIFKLEQNLKNHNVVLLKAYCYGIINLGYNFRFKSSLNLKMVAILKISKYFR